MSRRLVIRILICLQLLSIECSLSLAQTIPSEKVVNWSLAMNSYSIATPHREINVTDYGAIGDGISDDHPAVMKAISALNGKLGVVYFPEGSYLMKSSISLPDSVILTGPGAKVCELQFNLGHSGKNCISIDKPQNSQAVFLDGGYFKESTKLYTDSAFLFGVGEYALISQNNGEWDDKPINWAKNAVGQIVQIKEIIGDTLYLENPLRISYTDVLNPKIKSINTITNSGVICLKIKRLEEPEIGGGTNIFIRYAANCFIRGVESHMSIGSHFDIFSSTGILIDGCYVHHAFEYNGASKHGYGVTLNNQTGECLITNNIFEHLRHAMMLKTGANGNVFAYNYSFDVHRSEWPNSYAGDISLHGHYSYANLFEGNIVQNIFIDHYWGPSGPYNTFFRNRAESFGVIMTNGDPTTSDNQNYVGNEITKDAFFYGNYTLTGTSHFQYGNNVTGTIIPEGNDTLSFSSYFLNAIPQFWNIDDNWPSIGFPNELDKGNIPAKKRYLDGTFLTACPDSVVAFIPKTENIKQKFQLRPNPASNYAFVSLDNHVNDMKEICILTTKGQVLFHTETDKNEVLLDLDVILNSGIYMVKVKTGKWIQLKKLLVFK